MVLMEPIGVPVCRTPEMQHFERGREAMILSFQ